MDKTKFMERPGDSEGFNEASLPPYADPAFEYNDRTMSYHRKTGLTLAEQVFVQRHEDLHASINPTGWQEVEGVSLPAITWAALDDAVLEETFQAWLRTSTRLENVADFRKRLRQRISDMIQRGWKCDPATVIDLTGLK